MKTKQKRHPSPRQGVMANQWETVESDTESLAHERAYQQLQLQICNGHHGQNKDTMSERETLKTLQPGDGEDETQGLPLYDSLEQSSIYHAKRNPTRLETDNSHAQMYEREETQLLSEGASSDLHDTCWMTNLKENGCFIGSPQLYGKKYCQVPEMKSTQSCSDRQVVEMKGGYRYIYDTSPVVVVTTHMDDDKSIQPYHLHPEGGQTSTTTSPQWHNHTLYCTSLEADVLRVSMENDNAKSLQSATSEKHESCYGSADKNRVKSPNTTEVIHATDLSTYYQQEQRCAQVGTVQKISNIPQRSPKASANKNLQRLAEDIVERNKITLGLNTSKYGSYLKVHAIQREAPHKKTEETETLKETTPAQNQNQSEGSDPEPRQVQETQQLQDTQISERKKDQRKHNSKTFRQQQPPAVMVKAEWRDCWTVSPRQPAAVFQPQPQMIRSSRTLPPAIHLNISLNNSSHLLPLLQQKAQDAIIKLESLHGCPQWGPTSEVQSALSTGIPAFQWPFSCDEEKRTCRSNEFFTEQQSLPRNPSTESRGLGSYIVLPPIVEPLTREELKMSPGQGPGQSINRVYPVCNDNSHSYLVQMEKQKQMRERVTYKAHKQLRGDLNQQCSHSDNIQKRAEKMKQLKLYSHVICEQNKKITRIPFLPSKNPECSDKNVARIKALEYAKTIAKPLVKSQPKQRQPYQSEGFVEHTPHLQILDASQLTRMELLRKRHEEEKKAVAHFRKLDTV